MGVEPEKEESKRRKRNALAVRLLTDAQFQELVVGVVHEALERLTHDLKSAALSLEEVRFRQGQIAGLEFVMKLVSADFSGDGNVRSDKRTKQTSGPRTASYEQWLSRQRT